MVLKYCLFPGNFHFANVREEDEAGSKYLCMTWHKELRSYSEGEDKIIEIHGSKYVLLLVVLCRNSRIL